MLGAGKRYQSRYFFKRGREGGRGREGEREK